MGLTFKQFTNRFPDDDTCLKYIFNQKCLSSPNYPPNGALMTQGAAV